MEEWKTVEGYEDKYKISNLGNLISIKRKIIKNIAISITHNGYQMVSLSNGYQKNITIHRLVAIAFIPNPENKKEVNHINGIKTDNRVENLEWATRSENERHAFRIGIKNGLKGKSNIRSKPVEQYTRIQTLIEKFDSIGIAERSTRVPRGNIIACCKGKLKTAGGFIWKYSS